jgi:mono/diheme cytochrome c family protein
MTAGAVHAGGLRSRSGWLGRGLVILAVLLGIVAFVIIAQMGTGPTSRAQPDATGRVGTNQLSPALVDRVDNHGQVLFGRYCDSCHPGAGAGIGANLRTAQSHRQYSTEDSIIRLVRAGGFDMPAFPTQMVSDDDLAQIASYVRSLPVESP